MEGLGAQPGEQEAASELGAEGSLGQGLSQGQGPDAEREQQETASWELTAGGGRSLQRQ